MSLSFVERTGFEAPTTYQDWLSCFELMKNEPVSGNGIYDMVVLGSFSGTEHTETAMQKQIVETVNAVLNKSIKRFVKRLNECIAFNELSELDLLFNRLKKDTHRALFFNKLDFLPLNFRKELSTSVEKQMNEFWDGTIRFWEQQSIEFSNSELEDALFLINRIKLF